MILKLLVTILLLPVIGGFVIFSIVVKDAEDVADDIIEWIWK